MSALEKDIRYKKGIAESILDSAVPFFIELELLSKIHLLQLMIIGLFQYGQAHQRLNLTDRQKM